MEPHSAKFWLTLTEVHTEERVLRNFPLPGKGLRRIKIFMFTP